MTNTLIDIHKNHHGKISDKWSHTLIAYENIFSNFRNKEVSLLEIGVQNGGSLEVWHDYFPDANLILGCEIDPLARELTYSADKIKIVVGDANSSSTMNEIISLCSQFDIIIDDGSHHSKDIITSFLKYFDLLKDGGIYIVEDLHASYWQNFEGGLFHPISSISFFKKLIDIINKEHWGIQTSVEWFLNLFLLNYQIPMDEISLESIYSVEFLNSMCVIRKSAPANNLLGKRMVSGEKFVFRDEAYNTLFKNLNGSLNGPPDQSQNPYSKQNLNPKFWELYS